MTNLKNELWRLFRTRLLWVSMLLGIIIVLLDMGENLLTLMSALNYWNIGTYTGYNSLSLFVRWIGVNMDTVGYSWFYLLFPLLAALPYSWSYRSDKKSGFLKNELILTTRKRFLSEKVVAVFLSGMLVIFIPLTIDLLGSAMFLPDSTPDVLALQAPVWSGYFFSELYYTLPWLHSILYLITAALWGGVISLLGMAFSCLTKSQLLSTIAPLILFLALDVVIGAFRSFLNNNYGKATHYALSPLQLLHASAANQNPAWLVCLEMVFFLAVALIVIFGKEHRYEVL